MLCRTIPEAFRRESEDLDAKFQIIHSPSGFIKRKSLLAPCQVTAAWVFGGGIGPTEAGGLLLCADLSGQARSAPSHMHSPEVAAQRASAPDRI